MNNIKEFYVNAGNEEWGFTIVTPKNKPCPLSAADPTVAGFDGTDYEKIIQATETRVLGLDPKAEALPPGLGLLITLEQLRIRRGRAANQQNTK